MKLRSNWKQFEVTSFMTGVFLLYSKLQKKFLFVLVCKRFKKQFFNCYLAAPWSTSGHYRGDSLTHSMLTAAFYIFYPKVTRSLVVIIATIIQSHCHQILKSLCIRDCILFLIKMLSIAYSLDLDNGILHLMP